MKKLLLILLVAVINCSAFSQNNAITTFILIRHAEKDLTQSTNDPDLSAEGKARAEKLIGVLKQTPIDVVYSTEFKRTRQTVGPIAQSRSLAVMTYQAMIKDDIDMMLKNHAGKTLLVSGHSNTIPNLVNYLIDEEKFKPMDDGEYGSIIVVSITKRGENAKLVWLKY